MFYRFVTSEANIHVGPERLHQVGMYNLEGALTPESSDLKNECRS